LNERIGCVTKAPCPRNFDAIKLMAEIIGSEQAEVLTVFADKNQLP
jgi:hypothetical protein